MIAQGTDGLSRADHSEGVMQGLSMELFVPLHLDPFERSPGLRKWMGLLTQGLNPTYTTPEDWYTTAHGRGTFIWSPAPAAAEVVVEQLGRARLKRPEAMHIIIVPRIMTGRWRKLLIRGSDYYLRVDWKGAWDLDCLYEPLLMFVCCPYRSDAPRLSEREKLLDDFQRTVFIKRVSRPPDEHDRPLLRKFLLRTRALCSV